MQLDYQLQSRYRDVVPRLPEYAMVAFRLCSKNRNKPYRSLAPLHITATCPPPPRLPLLMKSSSCKTALVRLVSCKGRVWRVCFDRVKGQRGVVAPRLCLDNVRLIGTKNLFPLACSQLFAKDFWRIGD